MDGSGRLPWRRDKDRFVAYPTATEHEERFAEIRLHGIGRNTDIVPHQSIEQWLWRVHWLGWFNESGYTSSKQEAADKATAAWWRLVQTEVPRDVEMEVAMIVARLPVRPIPNSLFGEEPEFLRSVIWQLHTLHKTEIADGRAPFRNVYDQLSQELARRRENGDIPDTMPKAGQSFHGGGYKPRRRKR